MSWIVRIVIGIVLVLTGLGVLWFAGMRGKWRPVIDLQRRVNRRVVNPRQMRSAGTPGAYAAVIHHIGRRTGTPYATPMVPFATADGFVIALPYGTRADWVRNVLAAGEATIDLEGETVEVVDPRVVPIAETRDLFPASEQRSLSTFDLREALTVRRA